MKLRVSPVDTEILSATSSEIQVVKKALSFRPKGYLFMKRYQHGWNGLVCLLRGQRFFPSGHLGTVCAALSGQKRDFDIEYSPTEFCPASDPGLLKLRGVDLRGDQIRLVRSALRDHRGILKGCTGSGKTECAALMLKCLGVPRTLVLQARKELVVQTAERFKARLGIDCGQILEGRIDLTYGVTITTVQTLAPALQSTPEVVRWLSGIRVLFGDECHRANMKQMLQVANACVNADYRIGLSATPLEGDPVDAARIVGVFGPVIDEITTDEQVQAGRAAEPHLFVYEVGSKSSWELPSSMFYAEAYDAGVVNCDDTLRVIREAAGFFEREGLPAVILVDKLAHGKRVSEALGCKFISGATPLKDRTEALVELRRGEARLLVASTILDEGVDVPELQGIILAGQGKSVVKLTQRLGRALRRKDKHNVAYVIDILNYKQKHLYKHSIERLKHWKKTATMKWHPVNSPLKRIRT